MSVECSGLKGRQPLQPTLKEDSEERAERMLELEDGREMLAVTLINVEQLWLPAQDPPNRISQSGFQ